MAKEKKESKLYIVIIFLFLIISILTSGFLIYGIYLYEGIESLIRYVIIGLIILNDIRLIFKFRKIKKGKNKKGKKVNKHVFLIVLVIYSLICGFISYYLLDIYSKINGVNKTNVTYTSYLITLSGNSANSINDINDMKLGILGDKKNPDGYIVPQLIINENKLQDNNQIIEYDDYNSMIADLYEKKIDGLFITSNYTSMFTGIPEYKNIKTDTKVITKKSKSMKKTSTSKVEIASTGKSVSEPFTILLMGIDSTDEVLTKNAIANGDTLILITFNPKTLNATMFSIPRDSYVPIACWSGHPENKITHAAAYGNDCMIETIQNYFDTEIDYYAKINFKGLVKLVNAVGGVEVDVPKELCTDDSSRGEKICINAGRQTLNGEQALVFARNRKQLEDGDFGRARHQQEIIMALVNKMKQINDLNTFMSILDTVSNSIDTNLTTKQILSFYDVGKDIIRKSLSSNDADLVNIQQLFLQGSGQMIYDERARMVLWDYVPNKSSRNDIIKAMKVNLELAKHEDIKEFSFSINEPYEKVIIGEGPYSSTETYRLLPDFTGDTESQARATASQLGISVNFVGNGGTVVSQSEPAKKRIDLMRNGLTLTLSGSSSQKEDTQEKKSTTKKDTVTVKEEDNNDNNNLKKDENESNNRGGSNNNDNDESKTKSDNDDDSESNKSDE